MSSGLLSPLRALQNSISKNKEELTGGESTHKKSVFWARNILQWYGNQVYTQGSLLEETPQLSSALISCLQKVATVYLHIQDQLDRGQVPSCTEAFNALCGLSQDRSAMQVAFEKESYIMRPFLAQILCNKDVMGQVPKISPFVEREIEKSFHVLNKFLEVGVWPSSGSPSRKTNHASLNRMIFARAALFYQGRVIYYSNALATWASLSAVLQHKLVEVGQFLGDRALLDELFLTTSQLAECIQQMPYHLGFYKADPELVAIYCEAALQPKSPPPPSSASSQFLEVPKPSQKSSILRRRGSLVAGSSLSLPTFQAFLIECSIKILEKNMKFSFADDLKDSFRFFLKNEILRSTVVYLAESGSLGAASFSNLENFQAKQILHSLQLFLHIVQLYQVRKEYQADLLCLLLHKSDSLIPDFTTSCPNDASTFERAWISFQTILEKIQASGDLSYCLKDPGLADLFLFFLKNVEVSKHFSCFIIKLAQHPEIVLTPRIVFDFCEKNKTADLSQLDLLYDAHRLFFPFLQEGPNMALLFFKPPYDLSNPRHLDRSVKRLKMLLECTNQKFLLDGNCAQRIRVYLDSEVDLLQPATDFFAALRPFREISLTPSVILRFCSKNGSPDSSSLKELSEQYTSCLSDIRKRAEFTAISSTAIFEGAENLFLVPPWDLTQVGWKSSAKRLQILLSCIRSGSDFLHTIPSFSAMSQYLQDPMLSVLVERALPFFSTLSQYPAIALQPSVIIEFCKKNQANNFVSLNLLQSSYQQCMECLSQFLLLAGCKGGAEILFLDPPCQLSDLSWVLLAPDRLKQLVACSSQSSLKFDKKTFIFLRQYLQNCPPTVIYTLQTASPFFATLRMQKGLSLSMEAVIDFCKTNEAMSRERLDELARGYMRCLDAIERDFGAFSGAEMLFISPPCDLSNLDWLTQMEKRLLAFSVWAKAQNLVFEKNIFLLLRHYLQRPLSYVLDSFKNARRLGAQPLGCAEMSAVIDQLEDPPLSVLPSQEMQVIECLQPLLAKHQFSNVQIYVLYFKFLARVLNGQPLFTPEAEYFFSSLERLTRLSPTDFFLLYRHDMPHYDLTTFGETLTTLLSEGREKISLDVPLLLSIQQEINQLGRSITSFLRGKMEVLKKNDKYQQLTSSLTSALYHSFFPPPQPVTNYLRIVGLSQQGEMKWRTLYQKSLLGFSIEVNENTPISIYLDWEAIGGFPTLFLSAFNLTKRAAHSDRVILKVSLSDLQGKERSEAFFSSLYALSSHILPELSEESIAPPDSARENEMREEDPLLRELMNILRRFQDRLLCSDGVQRVIKTEIAEKIGEHLLRTDDVQNMIEFLGNVKTAYRNLYLCHLSESHSNTFVELTPFRMAAEGSIYSLESDISLLPPKLLEKQGDDSVCYCPEATPDLLARLHHTVRQTMPCPSHQSSSSSSAPTNGALHKNGVVHLNWALQLSNEKGKREIYPLYVRIQTLEELVNQSIEKIGQWTELGAPMDQAREGKYITLFIHYKNKELRKPLFYSARSLSDPIIFGTQIKLQILYLKSMYYFELTLNN